MEESRQLLVDFGFTKLESDIYIFLLKESPVTGYRIAQATGKAVANTYKAIQSLQKKGAIIVDDSEKRLCRAIPAEELLNRLERQFTDRKNKAKKTLFKIGEQQSDDRIYQLQSVEQVAERIRQMLSRSQQVVIIDAFPEILKLLEDDIIDCVNKGVKVHIIAYSDCEIKGADIIIHIEGQSIINRWPGEWFNIVTDGAEYMFSLFSKDLNEIIQAVWSSNPYLSWVYYSGALSEFQLNTLRGLIRLNSSAKELRKTLDFYNPLYLMEAPGYQILLKRYEK